MTGLEQLMTNTPSRVRARAEEKAEAAAEAKRIMETVKAIVRDEYEPEGKRAIGTAWHHAKHLTFVERKLDAEDMHCACQEIADLLETAAKVLFGVDDITSLCGVGDEYEYTSFRERFPNE